MDRYLLHLWFLISISFQGWSQRPPSLFDTLYAEKDIVLTLTYPFDSLYKANRGEIDATVSIETSKGFLIKDKALTINLRGKFRRMKCTMPPLMLNFKESTLRALHLDTIDEIKLVTHCLPGPEGQENLQEERLCYQIYEKISTYSYRTIWLKVNYRDALHPDSVIYSAAFLLEPDKVLSYRLGLEEKKVFNISEDSLDYNSYSTTAAYNCLIGNRDWSIVASRNAKLFYSHSLQRFVVVPYDFDFANIVGATYRRDILPKSMTHPFDRIFEGEYYNAKAGEILKKFTETEIVVMNAIQTAENPIDHARKKKITRYFETWYDQTRKSKLEELGYGSIFSYKGGL